MKTPCFLIRRRVYVRLEAARNHMTRVGEERVESSDLLRPPPPPTRALPLVSRTTEPRIHRPRPSRRRTSSARSRWPPPATALAAPRELHLEQVASVGQDRIPSHAGTTSSYRVRPDERPDRDCRARRVRPYGAPYACQIRPDGRLSTSPRSASASPRRWRPRTAPATELHHPRSSGPPLSLHHIHGRRREAMGACPLLHPRRRGDSG
jgi:hypothetical protein